MIFIRQRHNPIRFHNLFLSLLPAVFREANPCPVLTLRQNQSGNSVLLSGALKGITEAPVLLRHPLWPTFYRIISVCVFMLF